MTNPHEEVIGYGKYCGTRFVNIPVGYLRWMVNEGAPLADVAEAELERRGTTLPEIEVTPHAVDRASLRCRRAWRKHARNGEGLYTWLARVAFEAISAVEPDDRGRFHYAGVRLAVDTSKRWPVLVTVLPGKKGV